MNYGRGALLGHLLMKSPGLLLWQQLDYPKNEEVCEKASCVTLKSFPHSAHIIQ
jgi:hypothetical protein